MQNPLGSSSRRQIVQQQNIPIEQNRLSWSLIESDIILSGDRDISSLRNIKNTVLSIRREFQNNNDPKIHLNPLDRDNFAKRMILVENQVQGLMRRKINFSTGAQNGQRSLDYTTLLNQKQNHIIELEKKIQNLEFQLRKFSTRQIELQNHAVYLNGQLRVKQQIINNKNQIILSEVASSNLIREALNKIRRNVDLNKTRVQDLERIVFNQVTIPDIGSFEIRPDSLTRNGALSRSKTYQQLSTSQQVKTRIVELFRQVERIINQKGQISQVQFQTILQGYILNQKQSRIYEKSMIAAKRSNIEQKYFKLRQNFGIAAGIYLSNIEKLKKDNPTIRINLQNNLFQIMQRQSVKAYQVQNGAVYIDAYTEKIVEVPVQDARTKHLINLLASHMKKFTTKYPQLLKEMDGKLCEFFQQQIIDCIQVDGVDRLVNIVKYVPQVVKVENVYAYSSQKTRKVQFHLRVLIKALLQELHKIKNKTGIVLQMDEGVLGMISSEIMGIVNVDDILKVFRPMPKIVEVQKIIQKIVERRVQVPIVIPVTKEVEKIIEVQKIMEVQRIVYVPLQIPVIQTQIVDKVVSIQQITQRIVQVPTVVQRIVEVIRQVIRIVEVPTIVQKIVQVQRIVQVERVVNHIQQQPQEIEIYRQKIVPVQTIVQKIVEVQVIKEKIVERIVQVPRVQYIERIVEIAVPIVEYRKALEVNNHIETIYKPVDRIVQKIIPVFRTIQRIVQVPQIIEKIVEVIVERERIKQVEIIREKLVREEIIKPVEIIVKQIVQVVREVPVQVQRIIQIPVIHEVIKRVQEIIEKPIIQRVENTVVKQVYLRDPMIVYEPKIVQVEKIVNHYIQVPKPVKYIQQKIIQIPRNIERIKEVRVEIDKIVEKIVQVPKVVQIQRIVQRIVIVPRVIEKIIQIPQIVQKIVQRIVQKIVIRQIQRQVQIPVIQQKIHQVQVIRNVYIEIQKPVDRVVDKLVTINNIQERVVTHQLRVENIVQVIRQVPKTMHVDKIVTAYYEQIKPVEIQRIQIVPREIAVPVQIIVQKFIPVREIVQKIIQVPQFIQKIVQTKQESVRVEYIQKMIQKIVVNERIKQVEKIIPYIQQVIKQIPTIVEKIITIESKVQQIITAQQIVQKIVERSTTIPRIYQVQKIIQKLIKVPEIIEVQRMIPQIIRVNEYIQKIVQKIIQVPRIIQKIKEIEVEREKIVTLNNTQTRIVEVQRIVEKIAILEQMKEVIKNVNHIEKVLKIVEQIQRCPFQVAVKEQILVEIPYIIEKIVQKIVVMPQIVEVLKYVHQVAESNDLLVVQNQQEFKDHQFKLLNITKNMKPTLDGLVRELKSLKGMGQFSGRVQAIQGFVVELQELIAFPKLVRIQNNQKLQQRIIQKQKIVRVPVQDEHHLRKQISMSILIQKLVMELKRISSKVNIPLELDDEIKMIFFAELQAQNRFSQEGQLKDKFNRYATQISRKFETLGPWAEQSQFILNTVLEERFKMALIIENANLQIQRAKNQYENVLALLNKQTQAKKNCLQMFEKLKKIFRSLSSEKQAELSEIKEFISEVQLQQSEYSSKIIEPIQFLSGLTSVNEDHFESKLRQKQATIIKLTETICHMQKRESMISETKLTRSDDYVKTLEREVQQLKKSRSQFDPKADLYKLQDSYKRQLLGLRNRNQETQQKNSQLKIKLDNANRQLKTLHQNQKFIMRRDEKNKVEDSSWIVGSAHYSPESLSHSQIKRAEGSNFSHSRYSGINYGSKNQDPRQSSSVIIEGLQKPQKTQQLGLMTPLQTNRWKSPQSTGMKYTQSFVRQQSRSLAGRSPQTRTQFTTPGSSKYEPQKLKQGEIKNQKDQSGRQYSYYYSPKQREKP